MGKVNIVKYAINPPKILDYENSMQTKSFASLSAMYVSSEMKIQWQIFDHNVEMTLTT